MFTEKHILGNPYNGHKLSRTVTGFEVSTVDCSTDKTSGWYGATVNLTPKTVPSTQRFSGWSATGATIENSAFTLTADATAKANFETAKSLTRQTDGHGTLGTTINVGFINETANLYPTPNQGYAFSGFTITGATLTGSAFTFTGSDVTAKAWFNKSFDYVTIGTQKWMSKNLAIDDGGSGIYTANVIVNGVDFGTQYYYTSGAALRVANSIDNWHLPNSADWSTLVTYAGGTASAGNALKSTAGWYNNGNGLDTYGFSAIPVGYYSDNKVNYSARTATFAMAGFILSYGADRNIVGLSYNYNSVSYGNNNYDLPRTVRLVHD